MHFAQRRGDHIGGCFPVFLASPCFLQILTSSKWKPPGTLKDYNNYKLLSCGLFIKKKDKGNISSRRFPTNASWQNVLFLSKYWQYRTPEARNRPDADAPVAVTRSVSCTPTPRDPYFRKGRGCGWHVPPPPPRSRLPDLPCLLPPLHDYGSTLPEARTAFVANVPYNITEAQLQVPALPAPAHLPLFDGILTGFEPRGATEPF